MALLIVAHFHFSPLILCIKTHFLMVYEFKILKMKIENSKQIILFYYSSCQGKH